MRITINAMTALHNFCLNLEAIREVTVVVLTTSLSLSIFNFFFNEV